MPVNAYCIVLASTITHAYWNFLLKRNGGGSTFVGLSKVLEVIIFAPAFLIFGMGGLHGHPGALLLIATGAFLSLANYAALGRAYQLGNLSIVYPVSRGAVLLFLPLLGYLAFGEHVTIAGWIAITLVICGIVLLKLETLNRDAWRKLSAHGRDPAILFAVAAALAAACYTVWDKHAVQTLPAFTYFYSYTFVIAIAYGAFLLRTQGRVAMTSELRLKWWPIAQVAILNTVTYVLVLLALRSGNSSYVVALRQLSVAVGAVMGWRLLGEKFGLPQRLGVLCIAAGCIVVALAH